MSAKIVKELVTKWTYKVDTKQLRETARLIKGLKGEFNSVRKASTAFGKGEISRIRRIRNGWQGLNKQVTGYRKNLTRMPKGGGGGGGRGSKGKGGVGFGNSTAFLAGRMAGNTALTSALLGGPALGAGFAAGGAVKAAADRQTAETRFQGLLGGGKEGEASATGLLDSLTEFAKKTPFAITQLRDLSTQILGGGFAKNEIIPLLSQLGDVTQGDNVKLGRMLQNMIEIKNVGKAFTRDIRQFGRAGIPIFKQLQKNLGLSGLELDALITSGKVGFKEIHAALQSLRANTKDGIFHKAMERQMGTFNQSLSNLGDTIVQIGEETGKPLLAPLTAGLQWLSTNLGPIAKNFIAFGSGVSSFIGDIPGIKSWGVAIALAFGVAAIAIAPIASAVAGLLLLFEDIGVYMRGGKSLFGTILGVFGSPKGDGVKKFTGRVTSDEAAANPDNTRQKRL